MNFVLIHGGFHGGWCWRFVAARLRALGHQVSCPTHTGMGERRHLLRADLTLDTFAQDILAHLYEEELTEVVLVGHSFGGLSVSLVADRVPERIRHLVYLDALLIAPGQTPYGALPPEVIEQRKKSCVEYRNGFWPACRPSPCRLAESSPVSAAGKPLREHAEHQKSDR